MIVSKKFDFDSAHFLPHYEGKCHNLHGHHWEVEVGIEGILDLKTGMVLDFADLNRFLSPLKSTLDHKNLNELIDNPTAENIAGYISIWIEENWSSFPGLKSLPAHLVNCLKLRFIKIWETEDSMVKIDYPAGVELK